MTDREEPTEPAARATRAEAARVMGLLADLRASMNPYDKLPSKHTLAKSWHVRGKDPAQLVYRTLLEFIAARKEQRDPHTFVSVGTVGGHHSAGYYAWIEGDPLPRTPFSALEETLDSAIADTRPGWQLPSVKSLAEEHGVSTRTVRRRYQRRVRLGEVEQRDDLYFKRGPTVPPEHLVALVDDVRCQVRDLDTGDPLLGHREMAASHHCSQNDVRCAKRWVMEFDGTVEPVGRRWRTKPPDAYPAQALADRLWRYMRQLRRDEGTSSFTPELVTTGLRTIIAADPELTVLPAASALAAGLGTRASATSETRDRHVGLALTTLVNEGLLEYRDDALVVRPTRRPARRT